MFTIIVQKKKSMNLFPKAQANSGRKTKKVIILFISREGSKVAREWAGREISMLYPHLFMCFEF